MVIRGAWPKLIAWKPERKNRVGENKTSNLRRPHSHDLMNGRGKCEFNSDLRQDETRSKSIPRGQEKQPAQGKKSVTAEGETHTPERLRPIRSDWPILFFFSI